MVDSGKVMGASTMMLVVSLVFNLLILGASVALALLGFGAGAVAGKNIGALAGMLGWIANWGLAIVGFIGNIAIIAYAGFSAAKKGNDMLGCGLVGLLIYAVVGLIMGVLNAVVGLLGVGGSVATSGNAATGAIMGLFGAMALGMTVLCGVGWYIAGLITNFLLALIGGMIGGAK